MKAPAAARVTGAEREYVVGLDLGQKRDYTAAAVIERCRTVYDQRDRVTYEFLSETKLTLTHLERLPLGTSYPEVVEWVSEVMGTGPLAQATLVVDETGVGAPVVDLLRRKFAGRRIVPVTITGGDRATVTGGSHRVPKRDLISGLVVAFENRELEIARGLAMVNTLIAELLSMRVTVTASGHERFEAWREGAHDDLVLAVALAWWRTGWRTPPVWGTRRLI